MARLDTMLEPMRSHLLDFSHDVSEKTDSSQESLDLPACPDSFAGPVTHATEMEKLLAAFTRWFWQKTAAGTVLKVVKGKCSTAENKALKMTGDMLLVPLGQA